MKRFRSNRVGEAGYSLVEVLVAVALFVVVASITGTLIVQANQTTRRATSAAVAQSQLQDTVLRISREVAVSSPITIAEPNRLETLTVRDGNTVRTQFLYVEDTVKNTKEIRSKTSTAVGTGIPAAVDMASGYKIVASNVTDHPVAAAGDVATPTILAYLDGNSKPVGNGVSALSPSELTRVARVKINLNVNLKERSKPLTLVTSMATRLGSPAGWGPPLDLPALDCPEAAVSRTATTATLDWDPAPFGATQVEIERLAPYAWPTAKKLVSVSPMSFTDNGPLSATAQYKYNLVSIGAAGRSARTCQAVVAPMAAPDPPVLAAYPDKFNRNILTWTNDRVGAADVDHYIVSSADSSGGALTDLVTVPGNVLTYTDPTAPLASTKFYKVTAYGNPDALPNAPSPENLALQFPVSPVTTGFKGRDVTATVNDSNNLTDGTNHVAWTTSAVSPRYNVYWTRGATDITATLANPASHPTPLSSDMTGASMGGRYSYWAVGANDCHADVDDPVYKAAVKAGTPVAECQSKNAPVEMGGIDTPTKVDVYQRPAAPALAAGLDLAGKATPSLLSNETRMNYTRNGDAGGVASGDTFCDDAQVECRYALSRSREFQTYAPATPASPASTHVGNAYLLVLPLAPDAGKPADDNWGRTFDWQIKSWNRGGWSNASAALTTETFPGIFGLEGGGLTAGYHFRSTNGGDAFRPYNHWLNWEQAAGTTPTWRYKTGANTPDDWRATPNDATNAVGKSTYSEKGTDRTTDDLTRVAQPGAAYDARGTAGQNMTYTVEATAANGQTRTNYFKVELAPGTMSEGKEVWECNPSTNKWRVAYKYINLYPIAGPHATNSWSDGLGINRDGTNPGENSNVHAGEEEPIDSSWTQRDPNGTYGSWSGGSHKDEGDWVSLQVNDGDWVSGPAGHQANRGAYMTIWNELVDATFKPNATDTYSVKLAMGTIKDTDNPFGGCIGSSAGWREVYRDGDWGTAGTNYPSQIDGFLDSDTEDPRRLQMYPAPPTNAENQGASHY